MCPLVVVVLLLLFQLRAAHAGRYGNWPPRNFTSAMLRESEDCHPSLDELAAFPEQQNEKYGAPGRNGSDRGIRSDDASVPQGGLSEVATGRDRPSPKRPAEAGRFRGNPSGRIRVHFPVVG